MMCLRTSFARAGGLDATTGTGESRSGPLDCPAPMAETPMRHFPMR
jgi:hypothetical protein